MHTMMDPVESTKALERVQRAIEDIRTGKMVVLVDDADRENEGDLCLAAELVTPEAINFMTKYARGLVCLSLTEESIRQLQLPQMVDDLYNEAPFGTAFTVSIEARRGVTTGISAADRAATILAAVAEEAKPGDLVRPGHVFPLRARKGGVLVRTGQTEGSVDLARLAGLRPAGVICEIMRDDGSMARMPDLEIFARTHHLNIVSIAELIEYRISRETLVRRVVEARIPTRFGGPFLAIAYENDVDPYTHLALVKGEINPEQPILVRVHSRMPHRRCVRFPALRLRQPTGGGYDHDRKGRPWGALIPTPRGPGYRIGEQAEGVPAPGSRLRHRRG